MGRRTMWWSWDLSVKDEPLLFALVKYRQRKNRAPVRETQESAVPNLISSITTEGRHMPILDLDFPHRYVESTKAGHAHLYLDTEISHWRWLVLMFGLYIGRQIELGYFIWSLRRGGNFVRLPSVDKELDGPEGGTYTYGWLFKLRKKK